LLARDIFGIKELVPPPTIHLQADTLYTIGSFAITNTILSSWLATLILIGLIGFAIGPGGRVFPQSRRTVDIILESLWGLFKGIAGERYSIVTFSFVATLFLFITANAWITLLPVYGPVLIESPDSAEGTFALLRGAGTDINMPLSLAIVTGIFVELHVFRTKGIVYFRQFFPIQSLIRGKPLAGLVKMFAAVLHDITILARLFSFTFRLFGALTAGELLRIVISFLTPLMLVVPFYGLEILLGTLQAFVFAGLTVVLMVVAEGNNEATSKNGN